MSHNTLIDVWFGLWGGIWCIYLMADSFTLGTGMLFPFLAKDRKERNQLQESVGPFWDSNEVWLVTSIGVTFAAFPKAFVTLLTTFYTPMYVLLFCIFFRAACLEFMHKEEHPLWQSTCKWLLTVASFGMTVVLGIFLGNLFLGIDVGGPVTIQQLLTRPALLCTLYLFSAFMLSGVLWTFVKVDGIVARRAFIFAKWLAVVSACTNALFFMAYTNQSQLFHRFNEDPRLYMLPLLALALSASTIVFIHFQKLKVALFVHLVAITSSIATGFVGMYPYVMPNRSFSIGGLGSVEAAASAHTLQQIFWIAIVMVPVVLGYQTWTYVIFKKKISKQSAVGYK
ncbi:MAG: cytochrome d ubiquinol oxidase subunit II [Bacilli bacterium]